MKLRGKRELWVIIRLLVFSVNLFCAVLLLAGCSEEERSPYPRQTSPCEFFDQSQEVLRFWLGIPESLGKDVRVSLPAEYLDGRFLRRYRSDHLDGAVLFRVRKTDFAPMTERGLIEGVKQAKIPFLRILASHPHDLSGDLLAWSNPKVSQQPDGYFGQSLGLRHEAGLALRDLYFQEKNEDVGILITCASENSRNAQCDLLFNTDHIGLKVGFDRNDLPDWEIIVDHTRTFAKCMTSKPENGK